MNALKLIYVCIIFLTHTASLATIVSAAIYKSSTNQQEIVIIAESPAGIQLPGEPYSLYKQDNEHKKIFLKKIESLSQQDFKTALLLPVANDFQEVYASFRNSLDVIHVLHLALISVAQTQGPHYNNLDFIPVGLCTQKILEPIMSIAQLKNLHNHYYSNNRFSSSFNYKYFLKTMLNQTSCQVSISDYCNTLYSIIERTKTTSVYNDVIQTSQQARDFFKTHGSSNTQCVHNVMYKLFTTLTEDDLNKKISWINLLNRALGKAAVELTLRNSEFALYKRIILWHTMHNATHAFNLLDISPVWQKTHEFTMHDKSVLSPLMCAQLFDHLTNTHSCNTCYAVSTLYCSRCKKAYYCSPRCQITDWNNHRHQCTEPQVQTT